MEIEKCFCSTSLEGNTVSQVHLCKCPHHKGTHADTHTHTNTHTQAWLGYIIDVRTFQVYRIGRQREREGERERERQRERQRDREKEIERVILRVWVGLSQYLCASHTGGKRRGERGKMKEREKAYFGHVVTCVCVCAF